METHNVRNKKCRNARYKSLFIVLQSVCIVWFISIDPSHPKPTLSPPIQSIMTLTPPNSPIPCGKACPGQVMNIMFGSIPNASDNARTLAGVNGARINKRSICTFGKAWSRVCTFCSRLIVCGPGRRMWGSTAVCGSESSSDSDGCVPGSTKWQIHSRPQEGSLRMT